MKTNTPPAPSIIPKPVEMKTTGGTFELKADAVIAYADTAARPSAELLAAQLRPATGFGLPVEPGSEGTLVFQTLEKIPSEFSVPEGRTKPWGTGQAVLMAAEVVNEPFAVLNADDFYGRQSFDVLAKELQATDVNSPDSCMVGFYIKNTISPHGAVTRGQCVVEDGCLQTVIERFKIERQDDGIIRYEDGGEWHDMGDDEVTSMNMWGFTPKLFDHLRADFSNFLREEGGEMKSEHLLPMIIDDMIQKKETVVRVLPTNEKWMGVTYPEDKPLVMAGIQNLVDSGLYPGNLWS